MPRKPLSKEERKIKRQKEYQRRISNPEALEKKREGDRLRKRLKKQQNQLLRRDPLALLADVAAQKEILSEVNEEEEEEEEIIDQLALEPEEIEEDNGPFEQEDGPIMTGFRDDNWNSGEEEEQGTIIYRQLLT
jgi:hypothetical protein